QSGKQALERDRHASVDFAGIRRTGRRARSAGRSTGYERDASASGKGAAWPLRGCSAFSARTRGRFGVRAPMPISLEVNGERVDAQVSPRVNLADFLREHLHLTGTHVGCEHGVCVPARCSSTVRSFGPASYLRCRHIADRYRLSRACPTATKSPTFRLLFATGTPCSAATVHRVC